MANTEEPMQVPHKQSKTKQIESLLGPLLSNWGNAINSFKFDDFQLTLFDLISNASDDGIQQYYQQKSNDIYKFILTLFIASLHNENPLRLANDINNSQKLLSTPPKSQQKNNNNSENPLNSILVSPAHTLPPPPKRRYSEKKEASSPPVSPQKNDTNNNDKNYDIETNKNENVGIPSENIERNLSEIDELKEKDKYKNNNKNNNNNNNYFNNITPNTSDDKLITQQMTNRNTNFFDDILLTDNDQTDNDFSKTYETYDGDEFFTNRTLTTREHTTTEKFKCNPKEKAIVDEWRHLLHEIKLITPTPQPIDDEETTPQPHNDEDDDEEEQKEDAVLVPSADDISRDMEDADIILIEAAEMIAPMTRIRGKFKLTSTSITFIPDQEQKGSSSKDEINLAMNPPPLPMSPHVTRSRGRASSYGVVKLSNKLNLNQSMSNAAPSVTASAHASDGRTTPKPSSNNKIDNELDFDLMNNRTNDGNKSNTCLADMVLNNDDISHDVNGNKQYWVTTSVCSSYQQVGGTRYRLMTAHRFWFIDELREIYYRRYQLRNCALELFFSDDTSWLFNLFDTNKRNMIFDAIMSLSPSNLIESPDFFSKPLKAIKTSQIHYKWCRREISNFEYLMRINVLAGRTFNDLTQYPVVPWVISDFESETIDLNDDKIYRDLSKPIGALNEDRLNKFIDRYSSLCEDYNLCHSEEEKKNAMHCFMYGTHYSSIGIILYYLLRMQPFTTYNLKFQGGKFDQPDRLFHSILDTWNGCLLNTSDVKELIPEFYYLTDFLCNKQNLDLGIKQCTKERVDNVTLPRWASGSAEKFIKIMREALESEYVSNNLHCWIDLIFGYKQQGQESIKSYNIFHPYTYEGNVSIDNIEDPQERRAILSQIDEFGQTPLQLFNKQHPKRLKKSEVLTTIFKAKSVKYYSKQHLTDNTDIGIISMSWPDLKDNKQVIIIGSDCCLDIHRWEQNKLSIEKKTKSSISKIMKIGKSKKQNKIGSSPISSSISHRNLCFATTRDGQYIFACGFEDFSFVVWDVLHSKHYQGITKHHDIVSCLALDEDIEKQKIILVTGSYDKSVMVWRVNINAAKSKNIKNTYKNNKNHLRKKSHSRKNSLHNNKNNHITLNELIDVHPIHVLENQLAAVLCVDVSLKSGIIVCCSRDGIVNVYNASTGEHYHMLQPYIDRAMKIEKQKQIRKEKRKRRRSSAIEQEQEEQDEYEEDDEEEEEDESKEEEECELSPPAPPQTKEEEEKDSLQIPSGELTIVRVSSVFGHVLCYSKQTRDIFLYSSGGELISYSTSRDDIYYDLAFSKSGNHIVCGGSEKIIRIKELPSFKTRKKFDDPRKPIRAIFLDKDETYLFVGLSDGNVLVYSLPQKAFVKSRVHTLTELGF